MRARLYRQRVRRHEDDIDDPWGTWDWAAAMIGDYDASSNGGPSDGRDPSPPQPGANPA
jgi:hypothetical protein